MQTWLICMFKSQYTDCNFCTITVCMFLSNEYSKYAPTKVYKIREFFSTYMCKNCKHNSLVYYKFLLLEVHFKWSILLSMQNQL